MLLNFSRTCRIYVIQQHELEPYYRALLRISAQFRHFRSLKDKIRFVSLNVESHPVRRNRNLSKSYEESSCFASLKSHKAVTLIMIIHFRKKYPNRQLDPFFCPYIATVTVQSSSAPVYTPVWEFPRCF